MWQPFRLPCTGHHSCLGWREQKSNWELPSVRAPLSLVKCFCWDQACSSCLPGYSWQARHSWGLGQPMVNTGTGMEQHSSQTPRQGWDKSGDWKGNRTLLLCDPPTLSHCSGAAAPAFSEGSSQQKQALFRLQSSSSCVQASVAPGGLLTPFQSHSFPAGLLFLKPPPPGSRLGQQSCHP